MITSTEFRRCYRVIEKSEVGQLIRERIRTWKRDEGDDRNYGGAPARFSVELFFAALLANARAGRAMYQDTAYEVLTQELERPTQVAFGIIKRRTVPSLDGTGTVRDRYETVTLRQVRAMMGRLEDILEPLAGDIPEADRETARCPVGILPNIAEAISTLESVGPYNEGDADDIMLARWAVVAENEIRARFARMIWDRILDATIPGTTEFATGSYAADETAVEAWALPSRDKKDAPDRVPSADPAAHWGHRTPTNSDDRELVFGYAATAMVRVRDTGTTGPYPVVCERLVLRPLSRGGVPAAIEAIDSLRAKSGATVNEVLADILYSQSVPANWVEPLQERGITPTFDLHPNDRGPRYDQHTGVLWLDGWPHCPNTPDHLLDLTHPRNMCPAPEPEPATTDDPDDQAKGKKGSRHKLVPTARRKASAARREADAIKTALQAELDRAAFARFQSLITERSKYAFRRMAGPSKDGTEGYTCPARAGYIGCAGCPLSELLPGVDRVANPPDPSDPNRVKCCAQETITAPGDVVAKTRQQHRYGTPKWIASFARRARIEGVFGQLKEPGSNEIRRGWTRMMGVVKTSIMLVAVVAGNNIEVVRRHARATGHSDEHHLLKADPPYYGFVEITDPQEFERQHLARLPEPDPPEWRPRPKPAA